MSKAKLTTPLIYILTFMMALAVTRDAVAQHHGHHGGRHGGHEGHCTVTGRVTDESGSVIDYATVWLGGTAHGTVTDADGRYVIHARPGDYLLRVDAVGFADAEEKITLRDGLKVVIDFKLGTETHRIDEVTVSASGVGRVRRSAFNAVAVDARELRNSTKSLSEALAKAPGLKLRETGGVGSDMQLMLDGFSGNHVKVFIDGVPQEGVGSSFGLSNIPAGYAERIEVYKGVVPVGFGTDALGGVINIVTGKKRRGWFADASYSYGSFNTHRSSVNVGQTLRSGFTYEINAFQNYSDNNYYVDEAVKVFEDDGTSYIDNANIERVRRFHDKYHNEAVVTKLGVMGKPWADRLMVGFTYSNMYQDIQTGVTQDIVFGGKFRKGHSLMPSLEWRKRDLLVRGLDVVLTANYNRNATFNVDTASYEWNWHGDRRPLRTPGEQSLQHTRMDNDNWNGTLTVNYRIRRAHVLTFNQVFNAFERNSISLLTDVSNENAIPMRTRKGITGLSYRLMPSERWNVTIFGKHYAQYVSGPLATDANATDFVRTERRVSAWGYGAAGTWFALPGLQVKVSYERAYRLPTITEMFGDGDLEQDNITIRPERSHNVNAGVSYGRSWGRHDVYAEAGFVYRGTSDYIERELQGLSGGKTGAGYVNHGRVTTRGCNAAARYTFGRWVAVGGNFTYMDIRDRQRQAVAGSAQQSATYGERMPNLPYLFANADVAFTWHDLGGKGNVLTVGYDNAYTHSFSRYAPNLGRDKDKYMIPRQFSHNVNVSYGIRGGRYNFSIECRNITDERLYDNFKLQRPGRAFYGKVRIAFGG